MNSDQLFILSLSCSLLFKNYGSVKCSHRLVDFCVPTVCVVEKCGDGNLLATVLREVVLALTCLSCGVLKG